MKKAVLIASIMAMGLAAAQGQTILMDYDDLNPTNGVHDMAVNDGGFENSTSVKAVDNFTQLPTWYNMRGLESASAVATTLVARGTFAAYIGGTLAVFGTDTGYTIQAGDQFSGSFDWRTAGNAVASDTPIIKLFYLDNDTLVATTSEAEMNVIYTFTANNAAALSVYETASWTTPIGVGDEAIGKKLMFSIEGQGSPVAPIHFARVDNIYIQAASDAEPPPPPDIGDLGIAQAGTDMVVSWNATNTATYVLQSKADLSFVGWSNLVENIAGVDGTLSVTNSTADTKAFYRVIIE